MKTIRIALLGLLVVVLCAGPALAEQHLGGGTKGDIVDFDFAPRTFEVEVGTRLTWTNEGARPHTVTDRGGTFDTGLISPGASDSVTFTVPGRYFFFCRINPGKMNGTIVVGEGAEPSKSVRVQAVDPARDGLALGFDPEELTVEAGTAVVFANVGGKPHSLTADDGSFDTGIVRPGASEGKFAGTNATVVPTKGGTFPFHCEVHPDAMKGTLVVQGDAEDGAGAPSTAPRAATIDIKDFEFDPKETSVAPGGTVTWKNTGAAPHTATFDDVDLDTQTIDPGADGALVAPAAPGNYSYRCNIHPDRMRAALVVVGQGTADPTKPDPLKAEAAAAEVGGGITFVALATGVAAAFLGGFGISAFARNKMGQ